MVDRKANLLLTAYEIRKALNTLYHKLKRYDHLERERGKTQSCARDVLDVNKDVCAACGMRGSIQAAHIEPLQECASTTRENIIPLCERSGRRENQGCHQLFDSGYASVVEIKQLKKRWEENKNRVGNAVRKKMQQRYKKHDKQPSQIGAKKTDRIQAMISRGEYYRARKETYRLWCKESDPSEKFRLCLKYIEVHRRQSRKGYLERARKLYEELSRQEDIPKLYLNLFYYEGGYIYLLLGKHKKARDFFKESLKAVERDQEGWRCKAAAATTLIAQCDIILNPNRSVINECRREIKIHLEALKKCTDVHSKRWVHNLMLHLATSKAVEGNISVVKSVKETWRHWHNMTVLEGWDTNSRLFMLATTGMAYAERAKTAEEAKKALRYLSRSMVLLLGKAKIQPERIRDVLFTIADMLDILKEKRDANRIRRVAERARDGGSWKYPYHDLELQS